MYNKNKIVVTGGSGRFAQTLKKVKSKYFKEQVHICRDAGLISNSTIIIGYPEETPETIAETMGAVEKLKIYPSTGFLMALPETGMWKYAIENGYIKDIDTYLTQITERQDFYLNMTKMTEEQINNETLKWLNKINTTLPIKKKKIQKKAWKRHWFRKRKNFWQRS